MSIKNYSESGRTLLEIIAVVSIMGLISIGVIELYQRVINNHGANALYEDIRARAILYAERKKNSIFSTDLPGQTTYNGLTITIYSEFENEHLYIPGFFKIEVEGVKPVLCDLLLQKEAHDRSQQKHVQSQRIYIGNKAYDPAQSLPTSCGVNAPVTFTMVYKAAHSTSDQELPALCSTDGDCEGLCQQCGDRGECHLVCGENCTACRTCDAEKGVCIPRAVLF